ncbi:hypothetical protein N8Z49_02255, partial [Amylibacter sp.]|nr:hypothetical protein [Amylibacter sp.]
KFSPGKFSAGWIPPHPTFFVRREIYEKYGKFDLSFKIAADTEYMMRLLEVYSIKTIYIPKILVMMRLGGKTNKFISNILLQNIEILRGFKKNKLRVNILTFIIKKTLNRINQFIKAKLNQ